MSFRESERDQTTRARNGELSLAHGRVRTPCFMPVGTNATVKAVAVEDLEKLEIRIILSNAYHLYLRPGIDVIQRAGGLHRFMAWKHNILTDSGGFQIFSLAPFRKIQGEGVFFRSHIDGSGHLLTPEKIIEVQRALGSDILMPLDVCTPFGITKEEAREAVRRTSDWAERSYSCWKRWLDQDSSFSGRLFAIVQGNFYKDLRRESARQLCSMDFPGFAIGGLSVGESFEEFREILRATAALLPAEKPRYLMGIGTPEYIFEAVENGIDLFDSVYPTRIARNALAFTLNGNLNLRLEKNKIDQNPIDSECKCTTCRNYSRSYLRHLFKAREIMAAVLTTHHNLVFIQDLILAIRNAISDNRFLGFKGEFLLRYQEGRGEAV